MIDIKIPEIGENIKGGNVVNILVKAGDNVTKGQDIIELETEKASFNIPSPSDGVIKEILINPGTDVKVGQVVMRMEEAAKSAEPVTPTKRVSPMAKTTQPVQTTAAPTKATQPSVSVPTSSKDTQLVVIGGGPGGYTAAFYAADTGMDVTLVDLDVNPGGVCLFRGCIPSKALLHAAKILSEAQEAQHFGIDFGRPKIDIDKLRNWKNEVVTKLTSGLGQLSKQRKVKYIQGYAKFIDSNTISIEKKDGTKQTLTFENAILCTGSRPIKLPFAPNSPRIMDSTSALDIESIPKTMLLVGGGYIGLELGTVYAGMGTDVEVVEMLPSIIAGADRDIAAVLEKRLKVVFKNIMVATKVTKMEETSAGVKVTFEDKDGKTFSKEYEKILVAIGRRPNTENLGLENTKITLNNKGFVTVNLQRQTTDPMIYAIGDVVGNPMLAHKASHEGICAVEAICGHKVAFEPNAIPAVVYTDPEIAWCGLTEFEAKEQERIVTVVKFPWGASGRAITLDRVDGMTKLIIDPTTERILGMAIVGPGAGELIAEGVLAIEMGAVAADLKMTIHPHPTLTETIMEAAESFYGHSTHIYKPKKN